MSDLCTREIMVGDHERQHLVDHVLMPKADQLAEASFSSSNERTVRMQKLLAPLGDARQERVFLRFEAVCEEDAGPVDFSLTRAVLLTPEASQLAHLAIPPIDEDLVPDADDEVETEYDPEDIVDPSDFWTEAVDQDALEAERAVFCTTWRINSQTLEHARHFDMLRFLDEEWLSFQESPNFFDNPMHEEPDVSLDRQIYEMIDVFNSYWDTTDLADIQKAMQSLGIGVTELDQ
jgi:hypothetical protein